MHRYGNIDYINKLNIKTVSSLMNKAVEESNKDKLFLMYVNLLPHMKKTVTFEEFYHKYKPDKKTNKKIDKRKEEEIMTELLEIEKKFKERS